MNWKARWITGGVLFVAVFLLGFIPQYMRARALDHQLVTVHKQVNSERNQSQMDELDLLCGHVYLETNLKNYGLASQYSTKFFDHVQAMMSQAPDVSQQSFLEKALAQRDAVTGGLAQGDPNTVSTVQDLFNHALEASQNGSK